MNGFEKLKKQGMFNRYGRHDWNRMISDRGIMTAVIADHVFRMLTASIRCPAVMIIMPAGAIAIFDPLFRNRSMIDASKELVSFKRNGMNISIGSK